MKSFHDLPLRIAAILLLSVACGVAGNSLRHKPVPWKGQWAKHVENRAIQSGVKMVGLKAIREAVATRGSSVLDARPIEDFRAGHVPGAQSLPLDLAAGMLAGMQIDLSPNQPIITYCARNDCDEGLELALFLRRIGFSQVTLFAGGLGEWHASGGTVEVGR